jgi:hypothetical protein
MEVTTTQSSPYHPYKQDLEALKKLDLQLQTCMNGIAYAGIMTGIVDILRRTNYMQPEESLSEQHQVLLETVLEDTQALWEKEYEALDATIQKRLQHLFDACYQHGVENLDKWVEALGPEHQDSQPFGGTTL